MNPTKEEIRSLTSKELKDLIAKKGRSMTNYERSQYCKKLKKEGNLKSLEREIQ